MTEPNDDVIRIATLAAVKTGAKSDAEAVRNYREAERIIRAALPHLTRPDAQGEPTDIAANAENERCAERIGNPE